MESNKILKADVLDIIFEHQNKQYGAYELRKNYHKRARKSVMIVAIFAIVVSSIPLIAGLLIKDDHDVRIIERPTIFNPDILIPPVPPTHPPVTQQTRTTDVPAITAPVITVADSVEDHNPQPVEGPAAAVGPVTAEGPAEGPLALNPGPPAGNPGPAIVENPPVKEETHETVDLEQFPEFPGGDDALNAFLKSQLKYPKRAVDADKEGKVVVEFVVDKEGNISDIEFLKTAGYGFDEEAERVLRLMPNWKPGKINGAPVKAKYQIPLIFEFDK